MNNTETEIVHLALENLATVTRIRGDWQPARFKKLDGELELRIADNVINLHVEVKKEFRNHQLAQILAYAREYQPFMLIAQRILPKLKEALRSHDIAYLESNGNIWLRRAGTFIWIDNNKPIDIGKEKTNRAFTRAGLKVIFHFLLHHRFINLPYREIAAKTGVALGQVKYVFDGLKAMDSMIRLNKDQYHLTNRKALLDKWLETYPERLQPSLAIGTFRFLKSEDFDDWQGIPLQNGKSWWGGEAAGDLYTNHLKPAELTIYTLETRAELMKNYRLVPDPQGNVKAYEKFWNDEETDKQGIDKRQAGDQPNENVVPPLLAYTDLINTGDTRCMETAHLLYHAFKDRFE